MTDSRKKSLARVQKLIAKAESTSNQNEQLAFFQKAQELIIVNGFEQADLEGQLIVVDEAIEKMYTTYFTKVESWQENLASVIAINHQVLFHFNTGHFSKKAKRKNWDYFADINYYQRATEKEKRTLKRPRKPKQEVRFCFFGKETASSIATYTFNAIILLLGAEGINYKLGFVAGLKDAYTQNWQSYELVPVIPQDVLDEYQTLNLTTFNRTITQHDIDNMIEYQNGYSAGNSYKMKKIKTETEENKVEMRLLK